MKELEELLRVAEPPLRFLARGGAARLAPNALPLERIRALAEAAAEGAPDAVRASVVRLRDVFATLPLDDPDRRREQARLGLEEIERLRRVESGEAPPPPAAAPAYRLRADDPAADFAHLDSDVQFLKGVGPRRAEQLARLGLKTLEDLLYHLPFRYDDRRSIAPISRLRPGEEATCVGEILAVGEGYAGRTRRKLLEARIGDGSGSLTLTWFHQVAWFKSRLAIGMRVLVHGRVEHRLGRPQIIHPELERLDTEEEGEAEALGGIVPIYGKPGEMSVRAMRGIVSAARAAIGERIPSVLPAEIAERRGLLDLEGGFAVVHEPSAEADVVALNAGRSHAHRAIVFDELFFLQLGMGLRKNATATEPGISFRPEGRLAARFRERLPFRLTGAQERVLAQIAKDMAEPRPMNRLVQGDVGSGKTVVAALSALAAIECGHQAAFMAPTEILAEQHARNLAAWLDPLGVSSRLLTGRITGRVRREVLGDLAAGQLDLVVGTHAIIQEGVEFRRLGLGIVDEQHRFGVMQRKKLAGLGENPDVLLMTATPIPRTLAMTLYGDLDLSFLDELPPGRRPIETRVVRERDRESAYARIREELEAGRQAYAVFPLVEESDATDLRSAKKMAGELAAGPFRGFRLALVHGQMKSDEKDAVMRRFQSGEAQLLVSTTVIEVGVDVPNATVMIVDHAEQFGLAQLHQLRGRVGRGAEQSYCFLISTFRAGRDGYERLKLLERETDGSKIAEADLKIRGPGELLGVRQSGLPDFRAANLVRDVRILEEAREEAATVLARDPGLDSPASHALRVVLEHRWRGRLGLARVG
jgi:ATP-dependent DNA helicase RecG